MAVNDLLLPAHVKTGSTITQFRKFIKDFRFDFFSVISQANNLFVLHYSLSPHSSGSAARTRYVRLKTDLLHWALVWILCCRAAAGKVRCTEST